MTTVNIMIEDSLKQKADEVFNELGISLKAALTMFIKATVRQRAIPSEMDLDPF